MVCETRMKEPGLTHTLIDGIVVINPTEMTTFRFQNRKLSQPFKPDILQVSIFRAAFR